MRFDGELRGHVTQDSASNTATREHLGHACGIGYHNRFPGDRFCSDCRLPGYLRKYVRPRCMRLGGWPHLT
jgi:hypothetical protein